MALKTLHILITVKIFFFFKYLLFSHSNFLCLASFKIIKLESKKIGLKTVVCKVRRNLYINM